MISRMLKYEIKRFVSLKIVWIFAPIYIAINFLLLLIPMFEEASFSNFEDTLSGLFMFTAIISMSLLIPYAIGTLSQEFKNDSFKLAVLAFPNRIQLISVKYLFSLITSYVVFILGFLIVSFGTLFISAFQSSTVQFFDEITGKSILFFLLLSIYFFCAHAVLFSLTLFVKNPLPAVVFNFVWIFIFQWLVDFVLLVIFDFDEGNGLETFASLIPIYGLNRFMGYGYIFDGSGGVIFLSLLSSLVFSIGCLIGSTVLFNKRDI